MKAVLKKLKNIKFAVTININVMSYLPARAAVKRVSMLTLGLCTTLALSLYAGGSVPDGLRRHLVINEEISADAMKKAMQQKDKWQSVGHYALDNNMLEALDSRARENIRNTHKKELEAAIFENKVRESIRMPLLPGPVAVTNSPVKRKVVRKKPVEQQAASTQETIIADAPTSITAANTATAAARTAVAAPAPNIPSAIAEDMATIEAFKNALRELKQQGLVASSYSNATSDPVAPKKSSN